jgi:hypothetical protein
MRKRSWIVNDPHSAAGYYLRPQAMVYPPQSKASFCARGFDTTGGVDGLL